MAIWTRQPQEQQGNYHFSGKFLVTQRVNETIPKQEILQIYQDTLQAVKDNNGLDYLQVFKNEKGVKLFLIDATSKDMFDSGEYDPNDMEYNNCVLCYPNER